MNTRALRRTGLIVGALTTSALDRQNPTLPVALSLLQSNYFVDYSIVLAGVLLATIPLLILFVFAGRQLVSGIMQGAVKG